MVAHLTAAEPDAHGTYHIVKTSDGKSALLGTLVSSIHRLKDNDNIGT